MYELIVEFNKPSPNAHPNAHGLAKYSYNSFLCETVAEAEAKVKTLKDVNLYQILHLMPNHQEAC